MTRKEFLTSTAGAVAAAAIPAGAAAAAKPKPRLKIGVSTYSYNGDLQAGCMTLEDVLADMHDLGAEGVEVISEALIPDYPNPSQSWVKQWFDWMDKYELVPTCFDCFVDTRLYLNRALTLDELVEQELRDLKLANRLGFKVYRGLGNSWGTAFGPPGSIWDSKTMNQFTVEEKCLAAAEKLDVRICGEIHAPARLKSPWIDQCLEFIHKHQTAYFGFNPDFGIFARRRQRAPSEGEGQGGRGGLGQGGAPAGAGRGAAQQTAQQAAQQAEITRRTAGGVAAGGPENPKDLIPLLPYCYTTHAKFADMKEDLTEANTPYDEIIPIYAQNGYDYYINSEYEGNRAIGMAQMQLRRQHCMIRKLWAAA